MDSDQQEDNPYKTMINNIKVSDFLTEKEIYELNKQGPYWKYAKFPVEIKKDIKLSPNNIWDSFTRYLNKCDEHPYFYGEKIIQGL